MNTEAWSIQRDHATAYYANEIADWLTSMYFIYNTHIKHGRDRNGNVCVQQKPIRQANYKKKKCCSCITLWQVYSKNLTNFLKSYFVLLLLCQISLLFCDSDCVCSSALDCEFILLSCVTMKKLTGFTANLVEDNNERLRYLSQFENGYNYTNITLLCPCSRTFTSFHNSAKLPVASSTLMDLKCMTVHASSMLSIKLTAFRIPTLSTYRPGKVVIMESHCNSISNYNMHLLHAFITKLLHACAEKKFIMIPST